MYNPLDTYVSKSIYSIKYVHASMLHTRITGFTIQTVIQRCIDVYHANSLVYTRLHLPQNYAWRLLNKNIILIQILLDIIYHILHVSRARSINSNSTHYM